MVRIRMAELGLRVQSRLPYLTLNDVFMLPFETFDAIASADTAMTYVALHNQLRVNHPSENTDADVRAFIAYARSGLKEDRDEINADAIYEQQNKKYGMPVADLSDEGLQAMGFENKTQTDQED